MQRGARNARKQLDASSTIIALYTHTKQRSRLCRFTHTHTHTIAAGSVARTASFLPVRARSVR